jgi:predicted secreted hydrolase
VKGKSWMDHQWADAAYSSFKWTWFSLQLENNTEIVCFRFEDKGKITNLASLISPSRQSHYSQVDFIPLGEVWQSSKTGTEYPLSWKIIIPEIKAEIEVSPLVQEQEMIFGPINYWEGGLEVKGRIGGQEVSGVGFMELVGYPVKKGRINFYQQKLKNQIKLNLKNILGR